MAIDLTRSREFSTQLIDWVRGKGRILIVAHDNPDPDSLAAAYALKHLFLIKTGYDATITFGGIIGRGENRVMVEQLEIAAVPMEQLDLDQFNVICLVDTQPGTGNNSLPKGREVHVVIDHHPLREETNRCRWVDVREDYGASATILFEYLLSQEMHFKTKLATILFYAIKSETQDLGREWNRADREAYLHLLPRANNRILFHITHPKAPRGYFLCFDQALKSARVYNNILVFNLLDIDNPDMVAEMADFLLRMEGIKVVLGLGRYQDTEIVSLRTLDSEINAGSVIRKVINGLGSAGGHDLTAGGQIRSMQGSPAAQKELGKALSRRLQEALGMKPVPGRKLLSS